MGQGSLAFRKIRLKSAKDHPKGMAKNPPIRSDGLYLQYLS